MSLGMRIVLMLVFGILALGQVGQIIAADANPPERMTYQGYLVDGNGDPLGNSASVNYDVIFRIYDAKSGGTKLWTEQQTVTVNKGYFSVLLGEGSQFNSEANGALSLVFDGADASDRFIGLTVKGLAGVDVEIAPRLRLVTSPYAFTASNARRLTDGSGNANIFNDGAALKLGAGSTPTLTLPEAGSASLVGSLTADLPGWGKGLQIDNGSLTTTMGSLNSSLFHFNTELPQFYFNKGITVNGEIRSYNRDTVLGPSNNTDTYLKIFSGSDDMHAYADSFYFRGDHDFKVNLGTNTELLTDASKFYMNKSLEVNGAVTAGNSLSVTGDVTTSGWLKRTSHETGALMGAYGVEPEAWLATNPIYVIGNSYKPSETTLSNMHGIGYAYYQADIITGNANQWGLYVAAAGTANAFISGYSVDGRSYIKNQLGGLGVGTDSPDTNAALTASGKNSTLGYSSWPKSLYITNSNNTLGTISGPGRIGMGFHGSNRAVYFIDEWEDHYTRIFYENGTVGTGSDIRLKKDIEKVEDVLDKLQEIRGVRYRYKADKETTRFNIGVIAQEVEKVFPELVNKMPSGPESDEEYMTVTYENITPILIEAVKELRVEKDEQLAQKDERINELEQRLAKLEELVSKIGQGE